MGCVLGGRAILENCKACAEQGNVREEMRKKDGFFPQMFKVTLAASKRRGNNLNHLNNFYLKAKAGIW